MPATWQQSSVHSGVSSAMPPSSCLKMQGMPAPNLIQSKASDHAGFSDTNWHSDLRMAPFDTSAALTAWVPLTSILVCTSRAFVL